MEAPHKKRLIRHLNGVGEVNMYCGSSYSFCGLGHGYYLPLLCYFFYFFTTSNSKNGSDSDTESVHVQLNILKTQPKKTWPDIHSS